MWKPFIYKSPEEASVILMYGMVRWKGQAVLFVCTDVTDRQQKAILQSERSKYPVRKDGHTNAFFSFSQLSGDPVLIMQSPGTNTLRMTIL